VANKTRFTVDIALTEEQYRRIIEAVGDRLYIATDKRSPGIYWLSYESGRGAEDIYDVLADIGVTTEIKEEYEGFSSPELSVVFIRPGEWKQVYYQRPANPFTD